MIEIRKDNLHEIKTNENHQIVWLEKASGVIKIDEKEFTLSDNNIITVGKKQIINSNTHDLNGIVVSFNDSDLPNSSVDSVCKIVLLYNYFNLHNQLVVDRKSKEEFNQLFLLMQGEYEINHTSSVNPVLSLLLQTLLLKMEQIIRNFLDDNTIKNSEEEDLLTHFLNALENNYQNNHQVQFYADKLNITSRKLNDITKLYLGNTTKEIITNRVYIEILKKLQFTSTTIKEISYQNGFTSPYHLTNFFTKINGVSPLSYREKLKK